MPTLSGTLQIHAPLNWLFDSDKLTLCLSSCQRAIGSTKGPAKSVQKRLRMTQIYDLEGNIFMHSLSLHFLFHLLALYFLCVCECFSSACFLSISSPGSLETAFSNQQGTYWQSEPPGCSECEAHTHRKYQGIRRRFVFQEQQNSKLSYPEIVYRLVNVAGVWCCKSFQLSVNT